LLEPKTWSRDVCADMGHAGGILVVLALALAVDRWKLGVPCLVILHLPRPS
jgi:hypothetical protein